jgi:hypothetical protein
MNRRWLIGSMLALPGVLMLAPSVRAGAPTEFEGGIGVIPVVAGGGANVVRGVSPGGTPWVIKKFEAGVQEDGDIRAEGTGLVLAGGNSIGSPDGVTSVAATLFCQTSPGAPPTFSAHSSGAHPLAADGDFKFKDTLFPVPPSPCTNPALLIRANNSNGPWLAAGIPH